MDRRDFLKKALAAGLGAALLPVNISKSLPFISSHGSAKAAENPVPDLVAVRNGTAPEMFDRGMAAMGGIGKFVKKGQKIVVKPNVSWTNGPEMASNTNPDLLNRIVRRCLEAGAAQVLVVDHTIEQWKQCWSVSGIESAAKDAGGKMIPAEAERYYHNVNPNGKSLKSAKVHEAVLECDVFIDVPVLKHHGGAGMTAAIKNLMGVVWDRRYYHANNLHQCIADFLAIRKPDLSIVDAYRVMVDRGPRGGSLGSVKQAGMQIISTDVVAADSAAASIFGVKPESLGYLDLAHKAGFGEINLANLRVERIVI